VNFAGSVVIALPTANNEALIARYQFIALGFGLVILLLSALSLWLTISSALRPLKEVERTSKAIASGEISLRLEEHQGQTEIARLNRSLNSMLNSIEGAIVARNMTLEQMRQFVADASHELRTPLVSVRGYAELYRMGALKNDEDVANAMGRIEAEAIRMTQLVESLLALARLDDAAPLEKSTIDLVALARDAATDINAAERRQKTVVVDLDGKELETSASLYAPADPASLRQVLTNLLANAARFSHEGGSVEVALGSTTDGFVIEVRDHGEGIPAELRERVFERFYRTDSSRNRETGGSGLGLSIVRSIVDRHRGQIVATETPGGGATFRVWLPKN
jgi:two-component system OmpR family sensor kinase